MAFQLPGLNIVDEGGGATAQGGAIDVMVVDARAVEPVDQLMAVAERPHVGDIVFDLMVAHQHHLVRRGVREGGHAVRQARHLEAVVHGFADGREGDVGETGRQFNKALRIGLECAIGLDFADIAGVDRGFDPRCRLCASAKAGKGG